jgi:hypothetical protein
MTVDQAADTSLGGGLKEPDLVEERAHVGPGALVVEQVVPLGDDEGYTGPHGDTAGDRFLQGAVEGGGVDGRARGGGAQPGEQGGVPGGVEGVRGHAAVGHGVRGQFRGDRGGSVGEVAAVRDAPAVELVQGEVQGEAGAAWGGVEALDDSRTVTGAWWTVGDMGVVMGPM